MVCPISKSLFIDAVHAVVPEDGKKELQEVLTEEEYDLVTSDAKVKVRWFFSRRKMTNRKQQKKRGIL